MEQENLKGLELKPNQCNFCLRIFRNYNGLRRHRKIKLLCRVKKELCNHCGNKYLTKKSLLTHQKVYCKKKMPELCAFVNTWLRGLDFTPCGPSQTIPQINATYVMEIIKHLNAQINGKRNRNDMIKLLLYLFRCGFISDDHMCIFLTEL